MDLLLGTAGWRRFVYYDASAFLRTGRVFLSPRTYLPIALKPSEDSADEEAKKKKNTATSSSPLLLPSRLRQRLMAKDAPNNMDARPVLHAANANFAFAKRGDRAAPVAAVAMMMKMEGAEQMPPPPQMDMGAGGGDAAAAAMPMDDDGLDHQGEQNNDEVPPGGNHDEGTGEDIMPPNMKMRAQEGARLFMPSRYVPPVIYRRVFAHPQRKYSKREIEETPIRRDFQETVYFHPGVPTVCTLSSKKQRRCSAVVRFGLNDAGNTVFVAHADGYAMGGWFLIG